MNAQLTRGRPAGPKARIAADQESREALAKTPVEDALPSQQWGGMRVYRYEVGKLIVDDPTNKKEVFNRWHEARSQTLRACNIYIQAWMNWHFQHGSREKIDEEYEQYREWVAADPKIRGKKPQSKVSGFPPNGDNTLYAALSTRLPLLTKDTICTLMKIWRGTLLNGKDARGWMKRWKAILIGLENVPITSRDAVILIKPGKFNIRCLPKGNEGNDSKYDRYLIDVQTSREDIPGKKRGRVFHDEFIVRLPARRGGSHTILDRCISGEYNPRNASLMYHEGKRRWFFLLGYQRQVELVVPGDPTRVAILRPCEDHPWELVLPEKTIWLGGDGRYVAATRRRVFGQRESRLRHYRFAGSANKGHGRKRALQPIKKLERAWKDFVKTVNHNITRRAVDIAVEHRCGQLVYEQPTGTVRDELFLATSGREGIKTQTFWDWHQIATLAAYKANDCGIHFVVDRQEAEEESAA